MKVIDLLNKIANGEIYIGTHFVYRDNELIFTGSCLENIKEKSAIAMFGLDNLNDEVEIIEEDKKIERLKDINTDYYSKELYYENLSKEEITLDIQTLKHKVNEIIDYLEENKND